MSPPTREFQRLAIDNQMPTTRGQAQLQAASRQSGVNQPSTSRDDSSSDEDVLASPSAAKGKRAAREESSESSSTSETSPYMARAVQIRDILSTFERNIFPLHFRQDVWDRIAHRRNPQDCVKQGDLQATIFQLAVNDKAVYRCLSQAQPPATCARHFTDKLNRTLVSTMADFDGIGTRVFTRAQVRLEVRRIAATLRHLVEIAAVDYQMRQTNERTLAEWLLNVMEEVCIRNRDFFPGSQPGIPQAHGRADDQANLFQVLIGDARLEGERDFALELLEELPREVISGQTARIDEVGRLLTRHQAPLAYRQKLQRLINPPSEDSGPSQAGRKRPAGGVARGGQKRTK